MMALHETEHADGSLTSHQLYLTGTRAGNADDLHAHRRRQGESTSKTLPLKMVVELAMAQQDEAHREEVSDD